MATEKDLSSAHLTSSTTIKPSVHAWSYYLDDQGCSMHTIKAFTSDILLLSSFLSPDTSIGNISTNDLNLFLDWMLKKRGVPCSPKTYSRRITSLKSFFKWLFEHGILPSDPAEPIIQKSVISPIPTILNDNEVDLFLQAAEAHRYSQKPDARYYVLAKLLFETGLKKNECLGIRPNHIETEGEDGAYLFVRYTNPQYRYKERKIALSESWVKAYQEYRTQYPSEDSIFPWSQRRLEYLLEDLSREAGLEKHVSFDMCRWTCALQDWKSGIDPIKIRQKLGISPIQWREVKMKLSRLAGEQMETSQD